MFTDVTFDVKSLKTKRNQGWWDSLQAQCPVGDESVGGEYLRFGHPLYQWGLDSDPNRIRGSIRRRILTLHARAMQHVAQL
jgi:hypothetical protein